MKSIKVEIYGQYYQIKGDMEEQYIEELASYVDKKMRLIANQAPTIDSLKLAILTSLNIADELYRLKENYEKMSLEINKRAGEALKSMDDCLDKGELKEAER